MGEAELKDLLRDGSAHDGRKRRGCPTDQRLAAYAEHRLGGSDKASVESHLADCAFCRGQVSFLVKSIDWPEPSAVPQRLVVKARELAATTHRKRPVWGWRWAAAGAAACLILTVGMIIAMRPGGSEGARTGGPLVARTTTPEDSPNDAPPVLSPPVGQVPVPTPDTRTRPSRVDPKPKQVPAPATRSRGKEMNGLTPVLLTPREGAMLSRGELEFRWGTVPDAVFYEVSVVTAAGDNTFSRRTEENRLRLPPEVSLASGAKYYVSVRAHLREGKTAKSGFVSFHVLDQPSQPAANY